MPSPDWHPADIKAELEKTGLTLSGLARANKYHESSMRKAIRHPWPKVERIIAKALGVPPETIWPSRYRRDGLPLREGRWQKATTGHRAAPSQKRAEH